MDVLPEVLKWSKTLPAWQSDALRRLFAQGQLTAADEAEVLALAKAHHGIGTVATAAKALSDADLPAAPMPGAPTILTAIQGIKNVNALAPDQTLTFGAKGVTVIYGGNGTGKSGYARILKRACRARDAGGPILPNVLGAAVPNGPAEATITIAATPPKAVIWKDGQQTPAELAEIAVLDGQCARVFIDEASAVSYIPYGLDVFPKLAQVFTKLKAALEAEVAKLNFRDSAVDQLAGTHKVGALIAALSAKTTQAAVDALATLSEPEQKRLADIEKIRAEMRANDPRKQAEVLRRLKRRVESCRSQVESEGRAVNADVLKGLREATAKNNTAAEAAQAASQRQFTDEPLSGVGSEAWKAMFRAAAEYSTVAYPGHTFPHVGPDSKCVLCQQALDQDAKARLGRFWDFLEDKTARDAQGTKAVLDGLVRSLKNASFAIMDAELVKEISEHDAEVGALLGGHTARMKAAQAAFAAAAQSGQWETDVPSIDKLTSDLAALSASLEARAAEKDALANPAETAKIEAEYLELDARRRLSASRAIVLKEIERLAALTKLNECIASLRTNDITKKGRELTEAALTQTLETALTDELKKLKMRLTLNFKQTGKEGQTKHQLQMPSAKAPKGAALSDVLSEGEQHVIAIAAFLAELRMAGTPNSIVFDDPVSSLDHNWMEQISKRLVEEGANRQVVVFTHNISFVVALNKHAAVAQVPLHVQWLRRVKNVPGHCSSDLPWEVLSAKDRRKALAEIAAEARKAHAADPDGEEYKRVHAQFYDQLRATWERTIEEVLLNQAVLRFRNSVETKRLEAVVIDDEDYKTIFDAMTSGSDETPAHDHAAELLHALKTPDDLDTEIKKLQEFVKNLEAKQSEARKRRKALTTAPAAPAPVIA